MAKASPLQDSFAGGEFSPLLYGRVTAERYKEAVKTCKNFIPVIQGPAVRRPGTYFVAEVKTSSKKTRLIPFEFSTIQAYIIEFGDQYLRFYKDDGQILSLGVPYEISSPYLEAHLFELKFIQSADVLYIAHPSYALRKLSRTGHTSWTLSAVDLLDGPYLPVNTGTTTITPSATTGAITLTASAALWATTDVGRLVRLKNGTHWGWAKITGYTSTTVVNATVVGAFDTTTATLVWRLGLYSDTTGHPGALTFHEDRLFLGGNTSNPQRLDGSKSGDYENFAPTDLTSSATVTADNAISVSLNSNDVNTIRWMVSDENGLIAGVSASEWLISPSSQSEALSALQITNAKRSTSHGSANIAPAQIGKAVLFVQRAGRKVHELSYFFEVGGYRAPDLSILAEHITNTGITSMAYQKEPHSLLWLTLTDGTLLSLTYDRDQNAVRAGWAYHIVGGTSDAAGTQAFVESVACIPSPDGSYSELWIVTKRRINGSTKRYVEYFKKFFDETMDQQDAFFVDCGLTLDNPITMTGATKANPVVITANAHGLSNGNTIRIQGVAGMTEINGNTYTVAGATVNTFELSGIDGTGFTTYISGGEVRKQVTSVSGLSHLEGQVVSICADGAVLPDATVTAGAVALSTASTVVHVGLGYTSDLEMLRLDAGSRDGTSIGKIRRTHKAAVMLDRSLGLKAGMSFSNLDTIVFRTTADSMTRAPALFSGIQIIQLNANYDTENNICLRQDQPLPCTILSVAPQLVAADD